jgi:hypothetical protein
MVHISTRHGWLWCGVFYLLLSGCGSDGPERYRVTGKVTWEGAPLPAGDIILTPTDAGIPDAGKIKDGVYELLATEGAKQVAIIAVREVGPVDPAMGMARRENYIPVRYNDATTLTLTVSRDGANSFDFALTEKEPAR